tara:strand:- start:3814 stop:4635 length:822 start_codon:yes stop_codon:yes gene_type:complete
MWEKRYAVLTPMRTETNIRFYDESQLKKLLNISLLIESGFKISKISQWSQAEINKQIESVFKDQNALEDQAIENKINGLIISMIDMDEGKFSSIYNTSIQKRGFLETILQVIFPFLERVGFMWGINQISPAEEHFISNLIRQKIISAIDGQEVEFTQNKTFLLYLPQDEHHELGLLISNYLIRERGYKTYYFGQDVPYNDLIGAVEMCQPDYILTFAVTSLTSTNVVEYTKNLSNAFQDKIIVLSGRSEVFNGQSFPENVKQNTTPSNLLELL